MSTASQPSRWQVRTCSLLLPLGLPCAPVVAELAVFSAALGAGFARGAGRRFGAARVIAEWIANRYRIYALRRSLNICKLHNADRRCIARMRLSSHDMRTSYSYDMWRRWFPPSLPASFPAAGTAAAPRPARWQSSFFIFIASFKLKVVVYSIGIPPQKTGEISMTGTHVSAKSSMNARSRALP